MPPARTEGGWIRRKVRQDPQNKVKIQPEGYKYMSKASKNAYLILENGQVFKGKQIGAEKEVVTEIVFNTSMTGYAEVLTDPSYAGQGVVMTYPLIGSVGVCYDDL